MSFLQPESLAGSGSYQEGTEGCRQVGENNSCFLVQADMRKPYLSSRVT